MFISSKSIKDLQFDLMGVQKTNRPQEIRPEINLMVSQSIN